MSKQRGVFLRTCASCRGEGVGYVGLCCDAELPGLHVEARTSTGDQLPCLLLSVHAPSEKLLLAPKADYSWIVVFPLLERSIIIAAHSGDECLGEYVYSPRSSRISSRLLTHTAPEVAALLRGYEQRCGAGRARLRMHEVWPSDDGVVIWRLKAEFPTDGESPHTSSAHTPHLSVFDGQAKRVKTNVVCMEDQVVPDPRGDGSHVRLVTFSCALPEELGNFYAQATLGSDPSQQSFAGMNEPRARGMLAQTRQMIVGATADPRYEDWFALHRATSAELARQREAYRRIPVEQRKLVSIVMPVYRTNPTFLREAIRSVLAQSYECWELIVVNVSGVCPQVDEVLASFEDERIHVLAEQNLSIAHNTNVGILAARGEYVGFLDHDDVIEPDTLWHYMSKVREDPSIDLLYCDEDHLVDGRAHAPAFKTFPNYGKLYTHNYVTHFLMVSTYVLERTERSSTEVSGAQDYDLTLKAFEVARSIVHVPRVLYHWREHEGSTSDGTNQKPFAHEAGRAALSAHLARRGIQAEVDDGPLPYTYRVRYELPATSPKVSIVIPTCDHVELLDSCISSILEKTTYPNFEVLLVENNSVEDRTFELYDDLRARDSRVRVIMWRSSVRGTFNYASVVNFGIRRTTGEYVIALNNDTEVIEPHWIEELLGCLMRPEVGIVGAKLLFGDELVQHVGVISNPIGDLGHACQNLAASDLGPGYANALPGDCAMVTGACHMMRRSLFEELHGYDEAFTVGYNDADMCLRAREAGYAVTVAAHALLHHHEFATRGREVTDKRLAARHLRERGMFCARHAEFLAQGDPAINPNTDPYSLYGSLGYERP